MQVDDKNTAGKIPSLPTRSWTTSSQETMRATSLLLLWSPFLLGLGSAQVSIEHQVMGLKAIYESTGGENWNWIGPNGHWDFSGTDPDPCLPSAWQGLTCVADNPESLGGTKSVQTILLRKRNMDGTIPGDAFVNLTSLIAMDVSGNDLTGNIPSSIGSLPLLQRLNLSYNELSGTFPGEIESLNNLTSVDVSNNQLTGCYLTKANFHNITFLDISNNDFTFCSDEKSSETFVIALIVLGILVLGFIVYEGSKGKKKSHNLWNFQMKETRDVESHKDASNPMHNAEMVDRKK